METVYLMLGGNLGNRWFYLHAAKILIDKRIGKIKNESSVYESEAWGYSDSQTYLNQAIAIETNLRPFGLLAAIHSIENELGRKRISGSYEARTIDIDILFYGYQIFYSEQLQIPHVLLHKRNFVLEPLSEIADNLIHPLFECTINQLKKRNLDKGKISKIDTPEFMIIK